MSFESTEVRPPRDCIRCILCGRLEFKPEKDKDKKKFGGHIADNHSIDARVQRFFRGYGGIRWEQRTLTEDELRAYEEILARILDRVRQKIGAGIDTATSRDEFRERANDYLAEAERAVRDAEMELEYRRKEVKLAARQY